MCYLILGAALQSAVSLSDNIFYLAFQYILVNANYPAFLANYQ